MGKREGLNGKKSGTGKVKLIVWSNITRNESTHTHKKDMEEKNKFSG